MLLAIFVTTRQGSVSQSASLEEEHQAYMNVISCLSRCDQSDCESYHQERLKYIYECLDVGTLVMT
jgi:hypothetical protein